MHSTCRVLAFWAVLALWASTFAFGQAFESTSSLSISGGVSIPTAGFGGAYSAGPFGRVTYRLPASRTIHIGMETGLTGPTSDDDGLDMLQVPLRLLAVFPAAGEAASTLFLAVGGGATINRWTVRNADSSESNTKVYPTYSVQLGYTLRPEAMTSTFFDIYIRYEQQFINDQSDIRNIDVGLGVGLCF